MCFGGADEVKETEERKMYAKVLAEKYNFAQEQLVPFQEEFMNRVDALDDAQNKDYLQGSVNRALQNQAGTQAQQQVVMDAARGDLASGGSKRALEDMAVISASQGADSASRAVFEADSQHALGLQNVVAMGSGQEQTAMAGLGDTSRLASEQARNNAQAASQRKAANMKAIGQFAEIGSSFVGSGSGVPEVGSNADLYGTANPKLSEFNIL